MFKFIRQTTFGAVLIAALANVMTAAAQDRVTINKSISFERGKISAMLRRRVRRGASHIYRVQARAGRQMAVVLKTGNRTTSFTISARRAGILEAADGVRSALLELPETGEYSIQIGTDATADYTLEVTIK